MVNANAKTTIAAADARRFTFSAATLIQNEPRTADEWSAVVDDLQRAMKAAQQVADACAEAEEGGK